MATEYNFLFTQDISVIDFMRINIIAEQKIDISNNIIKISNEWTDSFISLWVSSNVQYRIITHSLMI